MTTQQTRTETRFNIGPCNIQPTLLRLGWYEERCWGWWFEKRVLVNSVGYVEWGLFDSKCSPVFHKSWSYKIEIFSHRVSLTLSRTWLKITLFGEITQRMSGFKLLIHVLLSTGQISANKNERSANEVRGRLPKLDRISKTLYTSSIAFLFLWEM